MLRIGKVAGGMGRVIEGVLIGSLSAVAAALILWKVTGRRPSMLAPPEPPAVKPADPPPQGKPPRRRIFGDVDLDQDGRH